MPLRLDLKPHEKIFVGGAVLMNGDSRCSLTVLNDVSILREKDILSKSMADTPCKRIYLAIQLMYMEPVNLAQYHQIYWSLVKEVVAAAPSVTELVAKISEDVLAGRYYQALKHTSNLIQYEKELVSNVRESA
jgi:flagellar protein FlbT